MANPTIAPEEGTVTAEEERPDRREGAARSPMLRPTAVGSFVRSC